MEFQLTFSKNAAIKLHHIFAPFSISRVVARNYQANGNLLILYQSIKKDSKELAEHYCPISLLPISSKVLERCVFNHREHLKRLTIDLQHGFLKNQSCMT